MFRSAVWVCFHGFFAVTVFGTANLLLGATFDGEAQLVFMPLLVPIFLMAEVLVLCSVVRTEHPWPNAKHNPLWEQNMCGAGLTMMASAV